MFDVKPTKPDGSLDLEKIKKVNRIVRIAKKFPEKKKISYRKTSDIRRHPSPLFFEEKCFQEPEKEIFAEALKPEKPNIIHLGKKVPEEATSVSKVYTPHLFEEKDKAAFDFEISESTKKILESLETEKEKVGTAPRRNFLENRFSFAFSFSVVLLLFSLTIPLFRFTQKGLETKKILSESGKNVLGEFAEAQSNLAAGQFEKAAANFEESYEIFKSANDEVAKIGGYLSQILRFIPGVSKVATANYLLSAGEKISLAGKTMSYSVKSLAKIENPFDEDANFSLGEMFFNLQKGIQETAASLKAAEDDIAKVNMEDLPAEIKPNFLKLKEKLPLIVSGLDSFSKDSNIILDVLGYNGPRKFLFLFQNNQEMRATGGFIGSYGVLDISNGRIKNLFVDDIYNPDGQLTARVIPPEPIQKMSAVWTMHDANWFPDFPTSAEKVAWFYEKTGGPTVDGVIAMTPNVIEKMLSVTGPIEMPEYSVTVDEDNFREIAQYETEINYDKKENRPKKFIADLTPQILDKLFNVKNPKTMFKALDILGSALAEKHILIYSKNYNVQKTISSQGWSGEMLNTNKDYLSVINSNINGYKTDGVIEEKIQHNVQIQKDGSIEDEVVITRKHNGGNKKYDWWNKVNGDWMRVYVPKGSQLLEASGQTREFVSAPLDYQSLQFKKDPQIEQIEQETKVDESTGTRVYTENEKTVFANWVYVSPGETVVLKYRYRLPFKLSFDSLHHPADSFSVLYQKQSGSVGSDLESAIKLPDGSFKVIWKYPDSAETNGDEVLFKTKLETDKFIGFAVQPEP